MASAALNEAIQHLKNGRVKSSKKSLDRLLKNEPDNPDILYYLGSVALMEQKADAAIQLLEKAVNLNPDDYRYHESLGQAFGLKAQQSGIIKAAQSIKKAKASFLNAIELNSNAIGSLEGLFMIYLFAPGIAGGNKQKALQVIEEMKGLNEARGRCLKAMVYLKDKDSVGATNEYVKAAELASDDSEIQMRVGHYLMNSDAPSRAMEYFDRYIEINPEDPRGYEFKGDFFDKTEDPHSAIQMYGKALEYSSSHFPARLKRIKILKKLNKIEEAHKELEYLLENFPEEPAAKEARALLNA